MLMRLNAYDTGAQFSLGGIVPGGAGHSRTIVEQLSATSQYEWIAGVGNDIIIYDGRYAYDARLLKFSGGSGNDSLFIGAGAGNYIGSVRVEGGEGDDLIVAQSIEGSRSAESGLFGGAGNDRIVVEGVLSFFGNGKFSIHGGDGSDEIDLRGDAYNLLGNDINVLDGGAGFDTLIWNARYNLSLGGSQTGSSAPDPYPKEIGVQNLERLIIDSSSPSIKLTADDVYKITLGSDFDRSILGFEGEGHTLFVEGRHNAAIDLEGWLRVGDYVSPSSLEYAVYQSGSALLVVDLNTVNSSPASDVERVQVDMINGGWIRSNDLFEVTHNTDSYEVLDQYGFPVAYATWDVVNARLVILPGNDTPSVFSLVVNRTDAQGEVLSRVVEVQMTPLSFMDSGIISPFTAVAIGDVDGDGRTEVLGLRQEIDGTFVAIDPNGTDLALLFVPGRIFRDNRLVDFDNDGDLDLIATAYAASEPGVNFAYLFRNDGVGNFSEVVSFSNMMIQGYGETIVTADFNNDGLSDLYLPYYFRNDPDGSPVAGSRLLINRGDLTFTDETSNWDVLNSDGSLSLHNFGGLWDFNNMPEGGAGIRFQ